MLGCVLNRRSRRSPDPSPEQPRHTGPDFWTQQLVQARFANRCAVCGGYNGGTIHHRKPRRAGGTVDPATNYPSNLLWVCGTGTSGCHGTIESHRTRAYDNGWLLGDRAQPAGVAVLLWDGRRVLLDDEGGYRAAQKAG